MYGHKFILGHSSAMKFTIFVLHVMLLHAMLCYICLYHVYVYVSVYVYVMLYYTMGPLRNDVMQILR